MSIQILGGVFGTQGIIPGAGRLPGGDEAGSHTIRPADKEKATEGEGLPGPAGELPMEAPPGTDPNLWSILTTEEREFFARGHAMGPVTYGRSTGQGTEPPMQRGSRIDVRV